MDVNRAAKCPGKYPPLATDTKMNSCFSKNLNNEIMLHKRIFLQRLQYFWAQIPRELRRIE